MGHPNTIHFPVSELPTTYIYPDLSLNENDGTYLIPFNGFVQLSPYTTELPDISYNEKAKLVISNIRDDASLQNFWWFADSSLNEYLFNISPNGAICNYGSEPSDILLVDIEPKSAENNNRIKVKFNLDGQQIVLSLTSPYLQLATTVSFVNNQQLDAMPTS